MKTAANSAMDDFVTYYTTPMTVEVVKKLIAQHAAEEGCTVCTKFATIKCAVCRTALYCSKACQKADWKFHKIVCHQFANPPPYPMGNELSFLVAHFPQANEPPKLCWRNHGSPEYRLKTLLRNDPEEELSSWDPESSDMSQDGSRQHTIAFWCRSTALKDPSKSNGSIKIATRGLMKKDVLGSVVVIRQNCEHDVHITPRIYRVAIEMLLGGAYFVPVIRPDPGANRIHSFSGDEAVARVRNMWRNGIPTGMF